MLKRFITALVLLPFACWSASLFPDDYDDSFQEAMIYMPVGSDWRLLKAQCYQESRLKRFAVSPAGARGLCQFMPNTWRELTNKYPEVEHIWLPEHQIKAAAIYMNRLHNQWSSPRPALDRYNLALASYNAGLGNLLQAQKRCDMVVLYPEIIHCLPAVTGRHSKETIDYVDHIHRFYFAMQFSF